MREAVHGMALQRLEKDLLEVPGIQEDYRRKVKNNRHAYYERPVDYAMSRYAYHQCYLCKKVGGMFERVEQFSGTNKILCRLFTPVFCLFSLPFGCTGHGYVWSRALLAVRVELNAYFEVHAYITSAGGVISSVLASMQRDNCKCIHMMLQQACMFRLPRSQAEPLEGNQSLAHLLSSLNFDWADQACTIVVCCATGQLRAWFVTQVRNSFVWCAEYSVPSVFPL